MGKDDILDTVRLFQKALEGKGVVVSKMILFGSWARGQAHQYSDIDVVVISDSFEGKDYWDRLNIIADAVYAVKAPIQASALTVGEWNNGKAGVCQLAKDGQEVG